MSTKARLRQIALSMGVSAVAFGSVTACGVDENRGTFDTEPGAIKGAGGGKGDAWSAVDSPFIFDSNLTTLYSSLPKTGEAKNTPWASSYWPYYEDSINHRWDGADSKSAAQKFENAYGLSGVEDGVSKQYGIDSQKTATACTTDEECDSDKSEACAKREGQDAGYCIPTWFGICPSWAAAAVTLPEPEHAVDFQGETFKINDIKALVSISHERVGSKFVSLRCNTNPDDIEFDADGRPKSNNCRFTNPATYHILLANYLGIRQESFVEDRTFSAEVWNQPLRGYKINEEREVTIAEANELIGVQPDNVIKAQESGAAKKDEWAQFGPYKVIGGDSINVIMTGNNDADLYVRLGSAPSEEEYNCRPYGNNSVENCNLVASASTKEFFVGVKGYADSSDFELAIEHGTVPTTYKFNDKAATLQYVKSTVSYITESAATSNGNLGSRIDEFTRTDTYEYILEIDGEGKLIGGEWVGSSKTAHPDFLWLPTTLSPSSRVASGTIRWADVKKIYEMSVDRAQPLVESQWNGNGSIISMISDNDTGFGLTKDLSRVHPGSANPAVFFQWEIDGRDGRRLEIAGEGSATITYGSWGDRSNDRVFENVDLPFVIDPAKDSNKIKDGTFYVLSVQYSGEPAAVVDLTATATKAEGSATASTKARPFGIAVDGHTWNGNGSVISHSSGSKEGYGLNYDIANIHPTSERNPVVFFQWEVSAADGKTLEISAEGMETATITYGTWATRESDQTKTSVSLPYVIDPAADGLSVKDGEWYVVEVAFSSKPTKKTAVQAKTPNATL